jgi:hypothetical protein
MRFKMTVLPVAEIAIEILKAADGGLTNTT